MIYDLEQMTSICIFDKKYSDIYILTDDELYFEHEKSGLKLNYEQMSHLIDLSLEAELRVNTV